jgi:peptidoglycan/LPS O-acetylase OafA/YrhL
LDWFGALLFFRNYAMVFEYLRHSPLALHWYTGHFWSLSMEEHFYFVLPGLLLAFKRTRLWVIAGLTVAVAIWRSIVAHAMHLNYQMGFRTDTHVDALLMPALIAVALYPLTRNRSATRYIPSWSFPILVAMEITLLVTTIPFFSTLQAIVIPLLILSTVLHACTIQGRLLEMKPLRWIGRISYSLYLWQQLFFGNNFVSSPPALAVLRETPINLVALIGCATFSYYLVEKPFVALGHKLAQASVSRSAASKDSLNKQSLPLPVAQ